jgi:hypothetical protein
MGTNADWEKVMNKLKGKRLTRASAIKNYCKMECCVGDVDSWKNCTIPNCFLWKFRLGKEILGNQTSFKKHRQNSIQNPKVEVQQDG